MSFSLKRAGVFLLSLTMMVTIVPALDVAYAMNDMSPSGSVQMPADKTLAVPQGQEVKIDFGTKIDYDSYYYFQIKPTRTGYITFTNDYVSGRKVALCNASKKVVSREDAKYDDYFVANSTYKYMTYLRYGVKKNKVYFIRVKGGSTDRQAYGQPYIGTVKWTNSAVKKTKYGKSKKKAVTIKRKKKKNGLFVAGRKKAQWYKIKTNKKKTKITFSSKATCGTFVAEVHYKSRGHWYKNRLFVTRHDSYRTSRGTLTASRKVRQTVYVKVYPRNSASGSYQLKWK